MSEPVDKLLAQLHGVRSTGAGRWSAKCPAHDDGRASLSVRELDDSRVLLHCHASCPVHDVLAAVGLTLTDLFPRRIDHHLPPERRPFPAADVLRAVAGEAWVAAIVLGQCVNGVPLLEEHRDRAALAARRLLDAADIALPPKDRRAEYRTAATFAEESAA